MISDFFITTKSTKHHEVDQIRRFTCFFCRSAKINADDFKVLFGLRTNICVNLRQSVDKKPYFHLISQCFRAFLLGFRQTKTTSVAMTARENTTLLPYFNPHSNKVIRFMYLGNIHCY